MTKEQLLDLIRLLSVLESLLLVGGVKIPDHLLDQIGASVDALYKEVLK